MVTNGYKLYDTKAQNCCIIITGSRMRPPPPRKAQRIRHTAQKVQTMTTASPRYLVAQPVYSSQVQYATLGANYLYDNKDHELVIFALNHDKLEAINEAKEYAEKYAYKGEEYGSIWRRKGSPLSKLYELVCPSYPLIPQEHEPAPLPDYTNLAIKSERARLENTLRAAQAKLDALAHIPLGDA